MWIRLRQLFKFVTARYAAVLPAGTKIFRSEWVVLNTPVPNVGGVFLSKVMLVKLVQPLNASLLMFVTLLGKTILVKPVQFWNALMPMLVTLLGIVILIKPVQPLNTS